MTDNDNKVIHTKFIMYLSHCVCNNCKVSFRLDRSNPYTYINLDKTNYCPHCGAIIDNKFIFKRGTY